MNMFGLDGSGFLISVCLTLLLSGMIVFYVRQALAENSHKMQAIMSIVQDLNTKNMVNMPHPVNNQVNNEILSTHPISNHLDTIPEEISLGGGDNKIDVSDDSDENSTTEDNIESDEEDDEDEDNEDDNNEVNSKENTDNNTLQVSDEQQDDVKKITMSEDVTEYEELKIDELNDITQNVLNETDSVFFEGGLEEKAQVMESSFGDFGSDQIVFCVGEMGDKIGTIRGYESIQDKNGLIDLRRSMGVIKELPPDRLPRINKDKSLVKMSMFIDVSRSMIRNIDREFLFKFVFECVRQYAEIRVFFFDTDITEVTEYFQTPSLKNSVEEMERARTKWGSGTRIGECIDKIISKDPFIVDRDTAVVIVSDGWDAGDLGVLSKRMAEIKRKSNISIWLNPPASSDNYEPEVRGMKTALPYIDYFFGFNSIEDLEKMTRSLKSSLP